MRKIALSFSLLLACSLIAGDLERRTGELVAMFNKTKHVSKNKRGVSKTMFVQVKSDPVVRKDPSAYSDVYVEPGFGFSIELSVGPDGSALKAHDLHAAALATLHQEYATVLDAAALLASPR